MAYFNRGTAYYEKGDYDRAIADYDSAIFLDPGDADAYLNRGIAYSQKGDHDRAIADFNNAIRLNPDSAPAYAGRGLAYLDVGDTRNALEDFRTAGRMLPAGDPLRAPVLCLIGETETKIATPSPPTMPETVQQPPMAKGAIIKIETTAHDGNEPAFITIEGELALGDEKRFADAAVQATSAVVLLSSPGGNVLAGIEIGKAIRLKGFATAVPEGFLCASACALAWLGGSPRMMGDGSMVGFHAVYDSGNGRNSVSSGENAVVGAYLNQLGLPNGAIYYISEPQPDEMRWLSFDDAESIGIEVRRLPSDQASVR